mgnify:FL=1
MIDLLKQFVIEYAPDLKALGYSFVTFLLTHTIWKKRINNNK